MHLSYFYINIVHLKPHNGGKGSGEPCHFQKIPLNEHVDFGKNETQKEIYHLVLFFAAH